MHVSDHFIYPSIHHLGYAYFVNEFIMIEKFVWAIDFRFSFVETVPLHCMAL